MVGMKRAGVRSYVSEPRRGRRRWKAKVDKQRAVYANRRRMRGAHGRRLMRRRGELVERSFAHVYDTGGMRRLYLRGRENIAKRLLIQAAGFNLGLLMRHDCGIGKPRSLQSAARTRFSAFLVLVVASFRPPDRPWAIVRTFGPCSRFLSANSRPVSPLARAPRWRLRRTARRAFSTGCYGRIPRRNRSAASPGREIRSRPRMWAVTWMAARSGLSQSSQWCAAEDLDAAMTGAYRRGMVVAPRASRYAMGLPSCVGLGADVSPDPWPRPT